MIWLVLGAVALVALAPLVLVLLRPPAARGRREADLALYRAQLAELDREHAAGRLDAAALAAARIEVQRRLLASPDDVASGPARGARLPLLAALVLVPAMAVGVYLVRGTPQMPSVPFAQRQERQAFIEELIGNLQARIATRAPGSDELRQDLMLLGNTESARGRAQPAAEAWARALAIRFDAALAGDLVEMLLQGGDTTAAIHYLGEALVQAPRDPRLRWLAGAAELRAGRPDGARAAWRALLADAPANAPWRELVERSLQELP